MAVPRRQTNMTMKIAVAKYHVISAVEELGQAREEEHCFDGAKEN